MSQSKYKVIIPDCIIRNENGININSKDFSLYYYLKILHDKQKSVNVKLNHNKFMAKFGIKTNSTFKGMLKNLYESKLINNIVSDLPRNGIIEIQMNSDYVMMKPFTMIHINLYYLTDKISHEGMRLMYYYESRINRNKDDHQFCFAGIRTITQETKINKNKIKEVNDLLKKMKLLKIEKHKLESTGEYDEFDQEYKNKFNNHYNPLLKNVEEYKFQNSG